MADFIIRPSGDSDWANALHLQASVPVTAQDAAALGLTLGANYQIGVIGELESFSVTDVPAQMAAPTLQPADSQITATLAADPADNGVAIDRFDLRHSTDQVTWTEALDIASPFAITGLATGTAHFVQSRAVNANGAGDWSASAQATTGTAGSATVPAAIGSDPSLEIADGGLTDVSALSVTFRLTDDPAALTVANRTAALVPLAEYTGNELNASAWTTGVFISQQAQNDEVVLTATAPGTHVMVWEAREADHGSNPPDPRRWSDGSAGSAQVLLDTAPAAMAAPSLSSTADSITVGFGADPTGGIAPITRRDVRYKPSAGSTWITNQDVSDGVVITGLAEATSYDVQTRAANEPGGAGAWSPAATLATQAGAGDTTPPDAASTAVSAQDQDGDVSVTATTLSEGAPNSFFVLTASATPPSQAQVLAGQDHTGAAAFASGGFSLTEAAPSDTLTGLPDVAGTYHVYVVYGDAVPNYSGVIHAGSVTLSFGGAAAAAPAIEQQLDGLNTSDNLGAGGLFETSAITIGSGANRMLVAAVATGDGTAFQSFDDWTATFGTAGRTQGTGTAMTPIFAGSAATNRRRHVIFFVLPAAATGAGSVQVTAGASGAFGAAVRLYELSGADQAAANIAASTPVAGADVTALSPSVTTAADDTLALTAVAVEPQGSADLSPEFAVSGGQTEDARGVTGTSSQNTDLVFAFGHDVIASAGASAAGWTWTTAADGAGGRIAIGGA